MSTVSDVEKIAMRLPKNERGLLASRLIASLGSPSVETDQDVIELAMQRDRDMDEDPKSVISEEEFWRSIDGFRRK
jgi:hypothetical protein